MGDEKKLKSSGNISFGGQMQGFRRGEAFYDVRMKLRVGKKDEYRGHVEFNADSDLDAVVPHEIFISKKTDDYSEFRLGYLKKRVGVEHLLGKREREKITRSYIYGNIDIFGFTGREYLFEYQQDVNAASWTFGSSISYSDSLDTSLVIRSNFSESQTSNLTMWTEFQLDQRNDKKKFSWAQIFSYWSRGAELEHTFEIFLGQNPIATSTEDVLGFILIGLESGEEYIFAIKYTIITANPTPQLIRAYFLFANNPSGLSTTSLKCMPFMSSSSCCSDLF